LIFPLGAKNKRFRQRRTKEKKQNTELRTQNSEYSKYKNQSHNKIHSARGGKILFNRLFDLDLLDLRPCPTGRFVVPKGLVGIIPNFGQKSTEINRG
jgi:hypothetical protein